MSLSDKKYGLIDPKAKKITVSDVFNVNSDSDDEKGGKDWIKKKLQRDAEKGLKKQTIIEMNRALEEDATVYQYDEVYDSMKDKETKLQPKQEKSVKYMEALMKTADRRKKENERRTERLAQKERETEGDMYKDKEEFITSGYRQKLEEIKIAEEEEKKMEQIESLNDVTKQEDMGSFYRHLYKETVDESRDTTTDTQKVELKVESSETTKAADSDSSESTSSSSSSSNSSSAEDGNVPNARTKSKTSHLSNDTLGKEVNTILEDGEVVSTADEEKKTPNKNVSAPPLMSTQVPVPCVEKFTKLAPGGRKDRSYRQRPDSKERRSNDKGIDRYSKSYHRKDERSQETWNNRDRGRERESSRRGERRAHGDRRSENRISRSRPKETRSNTHSLTNPKKNDRGSKRVQGNSSEEVKERMPKQELKDEPSKKAQNEMNTELVIDHKKLRDNGVLINSTNIWKKRTIEAVYDAAIQRYFSRKKLSR